MGNKALALREIIASVLGCNLSCNKLFRGRERRQRSRNPERIDLMHNIGFRCRVALLSCALGGHALLSRAQIVVPSAEATIPSLLVKATASREKYPVYRPLLVQYDVYTPRPVKLDHEGQPLANAQVQSVQQLQLRATAPLLLTKSLRLLADFTYLREQGALNQLEVPDFQSAPRALSWTRQDVTLSVTALHQDSLFHRPVIYLATLTANSREFGQVEKLTGLLTTTLTLRSTPSTKVALGVVARWNPALRTPVLPLVTYWHRFAHSEWEVDMLLPSYLQFRRPLASKGWVSLGTSFTSTHFFGSTSYSPLSPTFEAQTTNLQTGVLVEYPVMKYLWAGLRAGLNSQVLTQIGQFNSSNYPVKALGNQSVYFGAAFSIVVPRKR